MLRTTLTAFLPLLSFLARLYPQEDTRLQFELRQQHAVSPDGHIVFIDVPHVPTALAYANETTYTIMTKRVSAFRPPSFDAYEAARIRSIRHAQSADLAWSEAQVVGPDVERRETLLELAKMTNNAYVTPNDSAWYALRDGWTNVRRLLGAAEMRADGRSSIPRLDGTPTRMRFVAMSLRRPTTRRSCSPSRVPRHRCSGRWVRRGPMTS